MRDAEQQFHDAAIEGKIAHDGDTVLSAHVASTVAEKSERGWRMRKLQQSAIIDALVASVMAHYSVRRLRPADVMIALG
jgi:phage terminase large subunit-like protein